jgi:hypothetical protein
MKKYFVSDFNIIDVPTGGGEWVDDMVIKNLELEFLYSNQISHFDLNAFYIFSNISLLPIHLINQIPTLNYLILEHDYKICPSRHPWRYENNIIPIEHRINYNLYKNAKAVFVQTTDHMNIFLKNDVVANFVNLQCSIWSSEDLNILRSLNIENKIKNQKYAVYYTSNWIKNTQGNLKYCAENKLTVQIIKENKNRVEFLENLSKCKGIVFFPLARETFCRLVVESKCLNMDVITSKNYGASLEPWFENLKGDELIQFLELRSKENIKLIEKYLN